MIKNFFYLDTHKLYSLSSQIFEGIADFIEKEVFSEQLDSESQKGPIGSGKSLADIFKISNKSSERKFLLDHSYSIFEDKLLKENKVFNISEELFDEKSLKENINSFPFIKIESKVIFKDVNKILNLFNEFNSMGEAITFLRNFDEINEIKEKISELKNGTNDKNVKAQLISREKELTNITKLAKEASLYWDPKLIENLIKLTKFSLNDQIEITQILQKYKFNSYVRKEYLREDIDLIVRRYSRKTERKFVVFGIVSQYFNQNLPNIDSKVDINNIKESYDNFIEHLANIENSVSGISEVEIYIDPIAIYIDLD